MKKTLLLITLLWSVAIFAQKAEVTYSINPSTFEETTAITLTIDGKTINESAWAVTGNAIYLWSWSFDISDKNELDSPSNGSWTASNEASKFTYNAGTDTYTCLLYTSPSPRDRTRSRMPSSA